MGAPAIDLQGILAVQPDTLQPGQHPEVLHPGAAAEVVQAGVEHTLVAAELVDDEAGQQRAIGLGHDAPGAVQARENAAAVDIADQHHRQPELLSQPHVDVVAGAQVGLGRGSGAFHDDEFVAIGQLLVGGERRLGQVPASGGVLTGLQSAGRASAQHHERAAVGTGLEQHRVEDAGRFDAGGLGLQVLRASDLGAVGADHRVV